MLLLPMLIPKDAVSLLRKSNILLLLMVLPLLSFAEVPKAYRTFSGRLSSAALVMSLFVMVLLSLPSVPVVVLKNKMPVSVKVEEPLMLQYCTVLDFASLTNCMVEVLELLAVLIFVMIRLLVLPVALTRPSMVTLSAPFRLIRAPPAMSPEMLKPVVVGYMLTLV